MICAVSASGEALKVPVVGKQTKFFLLIIAEAATFPSHSLKGETNGRVLMLVCVTSFVRCVYFRLANFSYENTRISTFLN